MNERIRELAEQAGISLSQKDFSYYWVESAEDIEKFAALIVRECVEVCHKMAEDSDSYVVHDGDTCAEQIKKHFGVNYEP